jgi:hypothetical protein
MFLNYPQPPAIIASDSGQNRSIPQRPQGPKAPTKSQQKCLESAAKKRWNALLKGGEPVRSTVDQIWLKEVRDCTAKRLPKTSIAGDDTGFIIGAFVPDPTDPPKGNPQGTGTRFTIGFMPIGQMPVIQPIINIFKSKPKIHKGKVKTTPTKPVKSWEERQRCIEEVIYRQIQNGEKPNQSLARTICD